MRAQKFTAPSVGALSAALMILTPQLLPSQAHAGSHEGINMPDTIQVAGQTLRLNGMGLHEYSILKIDVYVAGLYLQSRSKNPIAARKGQNPARVVMHFVRSVGGRMLPDGISDALTKRAGRSLSMLKRRIDRFSELLPDVEKGDRLSFTYVPGVGTDVTLNGKSQGVIRGSDFWQLFFEGFVGPPAPKQLRIGLLGLRSP